MDIDVARKNVIKVLDKYLGQEYILFLFGSFARGDTVRSSDIDLAVFREEQIRDAQMPEIREEINEKAGTLRDIELVNLTDRSVNSSLVKEILKEGILWKKPKNYNDLLESLKKRF